ncbi:MAG: hypothetical protein SFU27_08670 [Thermonemataceae bacterium]|nr:hypothetical protein [Thermonemataceae bacterium]
MKSYFLLLMCIGLVVYPSFAQQKQLSEYFTKVVYRPQPSATQPDDSEKKLKKYRLAKQLSSQEKSELRAIQEKDTLEKSEKYKLYDFNNDKRWDLLLVEATYFGPSKGFQFYANTPSGIKYICDNADSFIKIQVSKQVTNIYYLLPIIERGECDVLYLITLNHTNNSFSFAKAYYAEQMEFGKTLQKIDYKENVLQEETVLRFSAKINEEGSWKELAPDEAYNYETKILNGNRIAVYPKNSKYQILSEKQDWLLVAFSPDTKPTEISLAHGMEWKNRDAYIVGWIKKPKN